eukprot:scaffold260866_cov32-Tisochrysis_lutea.AAC.3
MGQLNSQFVKSRAFAAVSAALQKLEGSVAHGRTHNILPGSPAPRRVHAHAEDQPNAHPVLQCDSCHPPKHRAGGVAWPKPHLQAGRALRRGVFSG